MSWSIVGPVPLLLGKTWIWPEVSNLFIFQNSMESQSRGRGGDWAGLLRSLGFGVTGLGTTAGRASPASCRQNRPTRSWRSPCRLHYVYPAAGRQSLPSRGRSPAGVAGFPSRPGDSGELHHLPLHPGRLSETLELPGVLVVSRRGDSARRGSSDLRSLRD